MRLLRFLSLCLVVCCLASAAHAGKINILDPTGFPTNPITTREFTIGGPNDAGFVPCAAYELPDPNLSADGCFAGVNRTGFDWSQMELIVPNVGPVQGTSFACNTDGEFQIFGAANCMYDAASDSFDLLFNAGTLSNSQLFIITEDGVVPPGDFPETTVLVTYAATTPEPPALLLLITGLLAGSVWYAKQRRAVV